MNRIGIVKTDEVGLRDFILSNFMFEVSQQLGTIVIYSVSLISVYKRILPSNNNKPSKTV